MAKYVMDDEKALEGRIGVSAIHYYLNAEYWHFRTASGVDIGIDFQIELIEDAINTGRTIFCQAKSTKNPVFRYGNTTLCFYTVKRSTMQYWLNMSNPVVLFVVDSREKPETIYYLPIQDYFIQHPEYVKELEQKDEGTYVLRIPIANKLESECKLLRELAKKSYIGTVGIDLREAQ